MTERHNWDDILERSAIEERLQKAGMSPEEVFCFRGCCAEYQRTFFLIRQYDEDEDDTSDVIEASREPYLLTAEMANLIVKELRSYLAECGESVKNFGVPRNGGIENVVGNIYQTWDEKELYPYVEDKAVFLFYFLVKDHLFVDGNKRIASFVLLWFMDMNGMLVMGREDRIIAYTTIYALAIFVAESNSKDKEIICRLIYNLIMTHRKSLPDEPYKNFKLTTY